MQHVTAEKNNQFLLSYHNFFSVFIPCVPKKKKNQVYCDHNQIKLSSLRESFAVTS